MRGALDALAQRDGELLHVLPAVRAIFREYSRSDAIDLATLLNQRLREVTDEFLLNENRERPDVVASILAPSIVPSQPG